MTPTRSRKADMSKKQRSLLQATLIRDGLPRGPTAGKANNAVGSHTDCVQLARLLHGHLGWTSGTWLPQSLEVLLREFSPQSAWLPAGSLGPHSFNICGNISLQVQSLHLISSLCPPAPAPSGMTRGGLHLCATRGALGPTCAWPPYCSPLSCFFLAKSFR